MLENFFPAKFNYNSFLICEMDPKIKIISGKNMIDEEIKQPSPTKGKRKARSASPSMEHIAKKRFSQDPLIEHEFVTITCSTPFIIPKNNL